MELIDLKEKLREIIQNEGIHILGGGMSIVGPERANIDIEVDGVAYEIQIREFLT